MMPPSQDFINSNYWATPQQDQSLREICDSLDKENKRPNVRNLRGAMVETPQVPRRPQFQSPMPDDSGCGTGGTTTRGLARVDSVVHMRQYRHQTEAK